MRIYFEWYERESDASLWERKGQWFGSPSEAQRWWSQHIIGKTRDVLMQIGYEVQTTEPTPIVQLIDGRGPVVNTLSPPTTGRW